MGGNAGWLPSILLTQPQALSHTHLNTCIDPPFEDKNRICSQSTVPQNDKTCKVRQTQKRKKPTLLQTPASSSRTGPLSCPAPSGSSALWMILGGDLDLCLLQSHGSCECAHMRACMLDSVSV